MNQANVVVWRSFLYRSVLMVHLVHSRYVILPVFYMNYSNSLVLEIHFVTWINNLPYAMMLPQGLFADGKREREQEKQRENTK